MDDRIDRVLIDEATIRTRLEEFAKEIAAEYQGSALTIIAVMRGSFIFLADLIRLLPLRVRIDLIGAESYGSSAESSGNVRIVQMCDLQAITAGQHVLLLDDILDTGRTLSKVCACIAACKPASLRTCVLLDKPSRRVADLEADFRGFVIEDHFVVGYGLDFDGELRNLPQIAVLREGAVS